jgi:hypothetical protein
MRSCSGSLGWEPTGKDSNVTFHEAIYSLCGSTKFFAWRKDYQIQSLRLRLRSGLRQSGSRFAAAIGRGAEAPLYLRSNGKSESAQGVVSRTLRLRTVAHYLGLLVVRIRSPYDLLLVKLMQASLTYPST